jgi:hypothetical protein
LSFCSIDCLISAVAGFAESSSPANSCRSILVPEDGWANTDTVIGDYRILVLTKRNILRQKLLKKAAKLILDVSFSDSFSCSPNTIGYSYKSRHIA